MSEPSSSGSDALGEGWDGLRAAWSPKVAQVGIDCHCATCLPTGRRMPTAYPHSAGCLVHRSAFPASTRLVPASFAVFCFRACTFVE